MKLYTWSDCLQAARDFAGDYAGDFDIEALAGTLFAYDYDTDAYIECEYTNTEIEACDVTAWQTCEVPATDEATMRAERWFQSPKHGPVHVGAWENTNGDVSLTLSTVREGGYSMWEWSSTTIADTDRRASWGEFDKAYGSRKAWETDLATVEAMIKHS